ncbi:hypothetical protein CYMTET_35103 [Cymbomonas tetramitiformis]|uniref:Uncharacterized protein n=1 Tax=Cymbomonas tetramitiformis TaxID=36881 RepID=A0AAE0F9Q7_9CHLO|nr:hypothetical protein CYMTET_35103 [Cymbomonas tetramitiformis]
MCLMLFGTTQATGEPAQEQVVARRQQEPPEERLAEEGAADVGMLRLQAVAAAASAAEVAATTLRWPPLMSRPHLGVYMCTTLRACTHRGAGLRALCHLQNPTGGDCHAPG